MAVPPERAYDVYADYAGWPRVFPTISAVRLVRRAGNSVVLEVDHRSEGKVRNELVLQPKRQLELRESKRRYDARFLNRFDPINSGTRVSVAGDIRLKGLVRLLSPLLGWYVRRLIQRFTLHPIKIAAEAGKRQPRKTS